MNLSAEHILLVGSILLFISIIAGKASHRFGVPVLLLFLLVGMAFGSDGLGIQFSNVKAAQFIGMIALSIILFSGGMDTSIKEIRPIMWQGLVLSSVGVLTTTVFTGLFIFWVTHFFFGSITFSLYTSFLLAAVMASTDSASVFSVLRSQKLNLKNNLRPLLEFESGSNDPMAYMLTIVLIQVVQSGTFVPLDIVTSLLIQFTVGAACGYYLGKFAVWVINKINIGNHSLYPILLLAFVFFIFAFTDLVKGNGYLAVYIAGLVVGNHKIVFKKNIATFFDGFAWLFQIIMFLALGLLVNPRELIEIAAPAICIGVFMIIVARPLSVILCLLPFRNMSWNSRIFISWVGLRGAVPIIFATYPVIANVENANWIFNIVFFITIISLVVQGTTVASSAKILHLASVEDEKDTAFSMELPEDIESFVSEISVTSALLATGGCLRDIPLPDNTLVIMLKRDNHFMIPNGTTELIEHDKLLLISDKEKELRNFYNCLGIEQYNIYSNKIEDDPRSPLI